jgi:membrane fusion protein, multidrug efflux system
LSPSPGAAGMNWELVSGKTAELLSLIHSASHHPEEHQEAHKITATTPQSRPVTLTQPYVCQIHSQRHIKVRALEMGYLEAIPIKEGQSVKEGDLLFKVIPTLYQAKLDAELAEANLAQLEFNYTKKLSDDNVVSQNEVALHQAKLAKAQAKAQLAAAEFNFATVKAPFDGIVDRLHHQQGSLVQEGEILTTLSDNSVMWVYFNVPEARYLEYMADLKQRKDDLKIELVLANGNKFPQIGKIGAIEADFNNETGNIKFRADFPNPDGLLFVLDKDDVAHQREIAVQNELEDLFVIKDGLGVDDKIVLEGVRQVRDGDHVEYQDLEVERVVADMKFHAE